MEPGTKNVSLMIIILVKPAALALSAYKSLIGAELARLTIQPFSYPVIMSQDFLL